jgi:DNA polymerase III subunit delta'
MSFSGIKDQETALRLLQNILQRGRVPNGLLFWGPPGVGKRMTAIELAKAVNCASRSGDACDTCLSCRKVGSGNHADVRIVSPSRKSRVIDLESVAELTGMAGLRPIEGRWRVFILLDAERLTMPAQNYFLKTLEEPAGNSLFVLTSEHPRMLLPTIRSRCQQVRFRCLTPETVMGVLREQRDLSGEVARAIAALAQGQMSRAFDLVDSDKRDIALDVTRRLAEGDDPVLLSEEFSATMSDKRKQIEAAITAELSKEDRASMTPQEREQSKEDQLAAVDAIARRERLEYLYLWESWFRDQMVLQATGDPGLLLNRDQAERIAAQTSGNLAGKIAAIEETRRLMERHISDDRLFRDLFLTMAGRGEQAWPAA